MLRLVLSAVFVFSFQVLAQDSTLLDDAIFQMRKFPTAEPIVGLLIVDKDVTYGLKPSLVPRDTFHFDPSNSSEREIISLWGGSQEDLADSKSLAKIEVFAQRQKFGLVVLSPIAQSTYELLRKNIRHFIANGRFVTRAARAPLNDLSLLIDVSHNSILGTSLCTEKILALGQPVQRVGNQTLVILKRSELAKILPPPETCNTVLSRNDTFCPYYHQGLLHP